MKGYSASIDHDILLAQLREHVDDPAMLDLLTQYLRRTLCDGGAFRSVERGISLGCPLSPLMGALYLAPLDRRMADLGCFYVRYMDDWVVLAPTRWKLRAAIRAVNQVMAALRVTQHPDKTSIGPIALGFDFLGYHFTAAGLSVARQTAERSAARVSRLYEQGAGEARIWEYRRRWGMWVRAGLAGWGWGCLE